MADNRARIQKDLEKSIIAGSIVTTDLNNEQQYTPPTTVGDVLVVGASGLPVWETPLDPARPWNKTGDLQATNAESVLTTDNILHEGRVNIGASEALTPFDLEYVQKIGDDALNIAHTRTFGYNVRNGGFLMDRNRSSAATLITVYLDTITGDDTKEPTAYFGATLAGVPTPSTSTTPAFGYKFKTFEAACNWINRFEGTRIDLIINGTSVGIPLNITGVCQFISKRDVVVSGNGVQYIVITPTGRMAVIDGKLSTVDLNITVNRLDGILVNERGHLNVNYNTTITLASSISSGIMVTGQAAHLTIGQLFTFNFSANNQTFVHPSGNGGCTIIFSNHSTANTWVSGAFTGLNWIDLVNIRSAQTWFVLNTPAPIIPSNIDMSGCVSWYGGSSAFVQKAFDINSFNYAINAGTTKPLRFTDLNSTSPDGAYTTRKQLFINELGEIIVG